MSHKLARRTMIVLEGLFAAAMTSSMGFCLAVPVLLLAEMLGAISKEFDFPSLPVLGGTCFILFFGTLLHYICSFVEEEDDS